MRKLAWILFFLVIVGTVLITLGAVDFAGIGTWFGTTMQNSVLSPSRNFIVEQWLFIGTNGWYILATVFGISIISAAFWVSIAYGLIWKKGIQGKLLNKTTSTTPSLPMQRTTSTTIPVQPLPTVPTTTLPVPPITPPPQEQETT